MSWFRDNSEYVCSGAHIQWGESAGDSASVHETPREVRALMLVASDDMIELHHHGDVDVPVYVDRGHIISIVPMWERLGAMA